MQYRKEHLSPSRQPVITVLLLALLLLLNAMAALPTLHELVHKDADQADHQCAVTLFAHGNVESATSLVTAIVPAVATKAVPQLAFPIFSPPVELLPPGRAPPAGASPSA